MAKSSKTIDKKISKRFNPKFILLPLILIAVVVVAISAIFSFLQPKPKVYDPAELQGYLYGKYAKEFVVSNIMRSTSGFGIEYRFIGTAFPKDNPGLTFEVRGGGDFDNYSDDYAAAIWTAEERPVVVNLLKPLYNPGQTPDFNLRILIPNSSDPDPIRGEVPTFLNALSQYRSKFRYSIAIKDSVDHELSDEEIKSYIPKLQTIVEFVKQKNVSSSNVSYGINVEGKEMGYICNLPDEKYENTEEIDNCFRKNNEKAW